MSFLWLFHIPQAVRIQAALPGPGLTMAAIHVAARKNAKLSARATSAEVPLLVSVPNLGVLAMERHLSNANILHAVSSAFIRWRSFHPYKQILWYMLWMLYPDIIYPYEDCHRWTSFSPVFVVCCRLHQPPCQSSRAHVHTSFIYIYIYIYIYIIDFVHIICVTRNQ